MRFRKFDLPPLWTLLMVLAVWLINQILPTPNVSVHWVGIVLMIYAVYIAIWSFRTLRKANTPFEPRRKPKTLVRSGPYALMRNPIYTAMLIFVFGVALYQGSIYGFLPVVGLFFILKHRFVEPEERRLIEVFGTQAEDYIAQTRRW